MHAAIAESRAETLSELFARSFSVVRGDTPALRDALFRLRYQVYCLENTFEDACQFPDGRETDEFDAHSLHAALIYKPSRSVVGGVRLIRPQGAGSLPIHSIVGRSEAMLLHQLPPQIAEISRYAVAGSFRRRQGEAQYADIALHNWSSEAECRRILPHITLGLMRAILGYCAEEGIRVLCATMAPALLRLLDRVGLHFQPIGPIVTFHGARQPCFAYSQDLLEGLRARNSDFHEVVVRGFEESWEWSGPQWPRTQPVSPLRTVAASIAGTFGPAMTASSSPLVENAILQ